MAGTDDYPYRDSARDRVDEWGFVKRQCTSFVAWRMRTANGVHDFTNRMLGGHWSNAANWVANARRLGYLVDSNPAPGAIAYWGPNEGGAGEDGHVAWVASVNSDGSVNIEEYNWNYGDGNFNVRTNRRASAYIHIRDLGSRIDGRRDEIAGLYRDPYLLGREPDLGGLEGWDRSSYSIDEIRARFRQSEEYKRRQAIRQLYIDLLDRDPLATNDNSGLLGWTASGLDIERIRIEIALSPERKHRIHGLYQSELWRAPGDVARWELDDWAKSLLTLREIRSQFLRSEERQQKERAGQAPLATPPATPGTTATPGAPPPPVTAAPPVPVTGAPPALPVVSSFSVSGENLSGGVMSGLVTVKAVVQGATFLRVDLYYDGNWDVTQGVVLNASNGWSALLDPTGIRPQAIRIHGWASGPGGETNAFPVLYLTYDPPPGPVVNALAFSGNISGNDILGPVTITGSVKNATSLRIDIYHDGNWDIGRGGTLNRANGWSSTFDPAGIAPQTIRIHGWAYGPGGSTNQFPVYYYNRK